MCSATSTQWTCTILELTANQDRLAAESPAFRTRIKCDYSPTISQQLEQYRESRSRAASKVTLVRRILTCQRMFPILHRATYELCMPTWDDADIGRLSGKSCF